MSNGGGQTLVISDMRVLYQDSSSTPHFLSLSTDMLEVPAGEHRPFKVIFDPEPVPVSNPGPLFAVVELLHPVVDGPHAIACELSFEGVAPAPTSEPQASPSP